MKRIAVIGSGFEGFRRRDVWRKKDSMLPSSRIFRCFNLTLSDVAHVILVDEEDHELGTMEKMEAHHKGLLHRAFSILLFNSRGELLLQKRSKNKYHCGGLWSNTCCSHPLPKEDIADAASRKLNHEMGIILKPIFVYKFMYKTKVDLGLTEHEYDYVFTGSFDGEPVINTEEVEDWKFVDLLSLQKDIDKNPDSYTHWFRLIVRHSWLAQMMT